MRCGKRDAQTVVVSNTESWPNVHVSDEPHESVMPGRT
jgi:hypothetical protein